MTCALSCHCGHDVHWLNEESIQSYCKCSSIFKCTKGKEATGVSFRNLSDIGLAGAYIDGQFDSCHNAIQKYYFLGLSSPLGIVIISWKGGGGTVYSRNSMQWYSLLPSSGR